MKKPVKFPFALLLILAISPLLLQCASQDDVKSLHYQLRIVSNKVDTMKANTVSSIQKRQASSSSQLDQLHQEILQLKSRIEELAHTNRMIQEQQKEHGATLQLLSNQQRQQQDQANAIKAARIQEAERKALAAKIAAEKAKSRRQQAEISAASSRRSSGTVETIRARKKNKIIKYVDTPPQNTQVRSKPSNSKPQQKTTVAAAQTTPADLMRQGKKAFDMGNFQKSFDIYQRLLGRNQSSSSAVEARFMMGESLFKMKRYNQAIMQYQKIVSNHPSNPKAAPSLLRQARSFEKLSDMETVKMIYKRLIQSYPSSPEATQARQLLNKL